MAFPAVAAADSKSGTQVSNATSWTITYPTNIAANDLLICFFGMDGAGTTASASGAGFSQGGNGNSGASGTSVLLKKAAGTETGTFTATISASEQGAWRCIRIPASQWFAGTVTASSSTDSYEVTVSTNGTSSAPDGANNNPANWDVEDTLWVTYTGWDGTVTGSTFPTNSTQEDHTTAGGHTATSGGAGGAGLAVCYRQLAAASENPGAFGLSASEDWSAFTMAIRPAATAATKSLLIPHRRRSLIVR